MADGGATMTSVVEKLVRAQMSNERCDPLICIIYSCMFAKMSCLLAFPRNNELLYYSKFLSKIYITQTLNYILINYFLLCTRWNIQFNATH